MSVIIWDALQTQSHCLSEQLLNSCSVASFNLFFFLIEKKTIVSNKFELQERISFTWGPTTPPGPGGPVFPWKP